MIRYLGEKHLVLPALLIENYQSVIGPMATMIWIDLLYLLEAEATDNWHEALLSLTKLTEEELAYQLEILTEVELITIKEDVIELYQPKRPKKLEEPEKEVAVSIDQSLDDEQKKKEAIYDYYHERIGMMGAKEFMLLNEWMEVRGLNPELVAKAIDITAENAQFPSMKYLDGILKNWFNANITKLEDLETPRQKGTYFKKDRPRSTPQSSSPAYKSVDIEKVKKWKELFKDDYKD